MGDLPNMKAVPLSLEAALYDTKSGIFSTTVKQQTKGAEPKQTAGSQQSHKDHPSS